MMNVAKIEAHNAKPPLSGLTSSLISSMRSLLTYLSTMMSRKPLKTIHSEAPKPISESEVVSVADIDWWHWVR
jgi:hypothetical protein